MWKAIKSLGRALFSKTYYTEKIFGVTLEEAEAIHAGQVNLGTVFNERVGFTEDTYPIVIISENKENCKGWDEKLWYYAHLQFEWRFVFDVQKRTVHEERMKKEGPELCRGQNAEQVTGIEASATQGGGSVYFWVRTYPNDREFSLTWTNLSAIYLLRVAAARINYLWEHGGGERNLNREEFGESPYCRWKNPRAELLDTIIGT